MIEKYEKYLANVDKSLAEFFKQQNPYIFCKSGCSICCEYGEYPFSELEFKYAMVGYNNLTDNDKNIIKDKVEKIKKAIETNSKNTKNMYECPFLIEKKCSIYKYRGLICRNHGLMFYTENKNGEQIYCVPHCVNDGLNYSNVFDTEKGTVSSKKWKETGIEAEPVSYNIGTKFLRNNNTTNALGLVFGDEKALVDWFL